MAQSIPANILESVLNAVEEALKSEGFIRNGPMFRLLAHGNCAIVDFQKSDKSSAEKLLFTINLGIVYGDLVGTRLGDIEKADVIDAHLRQRIGILLPERPDKWWDVSASTDELLLAQEVTNLLLTEGIPYLKRYLRTEDIIALWESGRSPGLTAAQRSRLLSKLKHPTCE